MISTDLLGTLHCPCCGSGFDLELQVPEASAHTHYGIIRCACYRYPIIDGIAILRQRSGPADTFDQAVAYLEAGEFDKAFHYVFHCASPIRPRQNRWQRAIGSLRREPQNGRAHFFQEPPTFREALRLHRPSEYGTYLLHRNANNSFLSAIPLLLLLKELEPRPAAPHRLLDLNCGVGHASFLTRMLFPGMSVIATDHDFVNLYLARRYMIPETPCICLDAELPLPFADRFFDAVLCMDGLHYVRSKRALLKELDRSIEEAGIWLFPHMHNALSTNVSPGVPLRPDAYQRCFEFLPSQLCIESEIFRDFMKNQAIELSGSPSSEQLNSAPVLSMVASRNSGIWRRHDKLADRLLDIRANLEINPIYQRNGQGNRIQLRMVWPSPTLERECEPVKDFLPRECNIDPSLWARLRGGTVGEDDKPEVEALIKSFVLVPLPDNYI